MRPKLEPIQKRYPYDCESKSIIQLDELHNDFIFGVYATVLFGYELEVYTYSLPNWRELRYH